MPATWEEDFYPEFAGTNGNGAPAAGSPQDLPAFPGMGRSFGRRRRGRRRGRIRERIHQRYKVLPHTQRIRTVKSDPMVPLIKRRPAPPKEEWVQAVERAMPGAAKHIVEQICRRIRRSSRAAATAAIAQVRKGVHPNRALKAAVKSVVLQAVRGVDYQVPGFKRSSGFKRRPRSVQYAK